MTTKHGGSWEYNVLCDVCGFKKKNWQVRRRWDNLMVCMEDWEVRHPMDFFQSKSDVHALPFTRPDNDGVDVGPVYAGVGYCTTTSRQPLADIGAADCMTLTS